MDYPKKVNKIVFEQKNSLSTSSLNKPSYTIRATIFEKCSELKNSPKLNISILRDCLNQNNDLTSHIVISLESYYFNTHLNFFWLHMEEFDIFSHLEQSLQIFLCFRPFLLTCGIFPLFAQAYIQILHKNTEVQQP